MQDYLGGVVKDKKTKRQWEKVVKTETEEMLVYLIVQKL